ncbi:glycosyltransferase [Pseudopedobacter beijingensis]|uniref:Glycosyltransferase n=1 Tax=Pseudopedobacter beijingensis TaxID=1207056 RepID=A0ABW4IF57_9SPHI
MTKGVRNKFGILAWPAYATRSGNPYNYLIYSNIEKQGHHIYEFDFNIKNIFKFLLSNKYRIFHIHWPTNILTYSTYIQAKRRVCLLKYFLVMIKLCGKKVVWTVHNLKGHESEFPDLQNKLNKILYRYTNGFISLNKSGLSQIKQLASSKKHQKFAYIPHPLYTGYYPNEISKDEARKILNIPQDKFVFLFLGQIRRYKNILNLINSFKELKVDNKFLLIAGKAHEELIDDILIAIQNQKNILFRNEFIADKDLQIYLNACNLIVAPYSNVFNSGSVFLNISFNKPTLVPVNKTFTEIKEAINGNFIKLYDGEISENHLKASMLNNDTEISNTTILDQYSAEKIAEETLSFYKSLLYNKK